MQFSTILVALVASTAMAAALPAGDDPLQESKKGCNGGCTGVCSEGYCVVSGKFFFPCAEGTCIGHGGEKCRGFTHSNTQCPLDAL
ncbi:unnamed protein product [Zymoseptoria tritici ST99CH_1A5]|uniref:Uncharacterized protein n=2 Tax=Zymoseptoria tritici TaxID=1047171 RepID=A0A1X7S3B6_ZYMT9|nr:unnamed protein product [Zymoseptoria tritici ST99CH_3D7]SMY27767.1 unnamed protein product [Zymoseptoria tritici ST99CH_1A5]